MPHAAYGVAEMPDYVEPFVAYRAWQWNENGITSLNNSPWAPKVAFEAVCPQNERNAELRNDHPYAKHSEKLDLHPVPDENCSCGMYAGINFQHLIDIGYVNHGIHGEVYLWGRLYRHSLGWRAQYAYPKNFIVPQNMLPFEMSSFKLRMESLIAYDVDIYLQTEAAARVGGEVLPLWVKDYGFSQQGIGWVLEQRAKSYAWKPNVKGLVVGDRLIILHDKGGIGIVEHMDEENVYFKLFGTAVYKIPIKAAKWNDRNWRWESSQMGTLTHLQTTLVSQ